MQPDPTLDSTGVPSLPDALRRRAAELGATRRDVAERFAVSTATVARWFDGTTVPTDSRVADLAAWLGVAPDEVCRLIVDARRGRRGGPQHLDRQGLGLFVDAVERFEAAVNRLCAVLADANLEPEGRSVEVAQPDGDDGVVDPAHVGARR